MNSSRSSADSPLQGAGIRAGVGRFPGSSTIAVHSGMTARLRAPIAVCGLVALTLFATRAPAGSAPGLELGVFSRADMAQGLPAHWQPLIFKPVERHTAYRLVREGSAVVLQAHAENAGSALQHELMPADSRNRWLRWRWKIAGPLVTADIADKQRDDAVARVLVVYAYDPALLSLVQRARYALGRALYGQWPPHAVLAYVWARRHAVGEVLANPLTDRARMIVLADAGTPVNRWRHERRDVHADYKRAFDEEPPPIAAIAVMTDTDVTGETATAWFGDIVLSP